MSLTKSPGYPNYILYNFCAKCRNVFPKDTKRCTMCKQILRTHSHTTHSGLKENRGLIE
jgi:hypothetical protein